MIKTDSPDMITKFKDLFFFSPEKRLDRYSEAESKPPDSNGKHIKIKRITIEPLPEKDCEAKDQEREREISTRPYTLPREEKKRPHQTFHGSTEREPIPFKPAETIALTPWRL